MPSIPIGGGGMVPLWAVAVLVVTSAAAVLMMLLVRRYKAPEGFIRDPVPPAGVFGVLGVAFAVLLAFVLFLSFESYVRAQEGASREAIAVTQLLRVTRLLPAPQDEELRGELVCYARSVVSHEWERMGSGDESDRVGGWLATIEETIDLMPVQNARTEVALAHWLDEMTQRREGRRARLAEASAAIPEPVWLMLILGTGLTVGYLVVFADRRERAWVQGAMGGTITALIVSSLLVIHFLDNPFTDDGAYIRPDEMSTTLRLLGHEIADDPSVTFPCNEQGRPA